MPPTPEWMTLHRDLRVRDLLQLALRGLDRALHVGLDDQAELLDGALLHRAEQVLEADGLVAPGQQLGAQALRALLGGSGGRPARSRPRGSSSPAPRRLVEAEDLDRRARPGLLDALAVVVVQRLDLAPGVAGDHGVADVQRAALDEHRGDRAAADVEPRLDDHAAGRRVRVGLQLEHVGLQQQHLEQLVEVLLGLRRDVDEHRLAAPLLGLQAVVDELGAHPLGVRVRPVDLVDGDHDRHAGGAWRGRSPRSSAASRRRRPRPPARRRR